ncbi:MAG: glycosyltransferase, partial [Pseudomonadota bacterium]
MDRIESYSISAAGPVRARRLVAVVVTHNRLGDLRITVQRLLSTSAKALSAGVVVDNASTDGSAAWLATVGDARLDVVTLAANTGGAGGFAAGIARALQAHRPDWLVVMDDDGRPDVGALETFHSLRPEAQGWDAVAAAVYTPEGEICEMNRPSRNPFWHWRVFVRCVWQLGRRSGFHLTAADYSSAAAQPVDIASFVGLFVSQQAARAVGGPDPRLFLYGDDGLFTLRLAQAGRRLIFHPQVRFEHACTTFGGAQFQQLWKAYYYHRNLMLLYRAAAGWMFWPLLAIVLP